MRHLLRRPTLISPKRLLGRPTRPIQPLLQPTPPPNLGKPITQYNCTIGFCPFYQRSKHQVFEEWNDHFQSTMPKFEGSTSLKVKRTLKDRIESVLESKADTLLYQVLMGAVNKALLFLFSLMGLVEWYKGLLQKIEEVREMVDILMKDVSEKIVELGKSLALFEKTVSAFEKKVSQLIQDIKDIKRRLDMIEEIQRQKEEEERRSTTKARGPEESSSKGNK